MFISDLFTLGLLYHLWRIVHFVISSVFFVNGMIPFQAKTGKCPCGPLTLRMTGVLLPVDILYIVCQVLIWFLKKKQEQLKKKGFHFCLCFNEHTPNRTSVLFVFCLSLYINTAVEETFRSFTQINAKQFKNTPLQVIVLNKSTGVLSYIHF